MFVLALLLLLLFPLKINFHFILCHIQTHKQCSKICCKKKCNKIIIIGPNHQPHKQKKNKPTRKAKESSSLSFHPFVIYHSIQQRWRPSSWSRCGWWWWWLSFLLGFFSPFFSLESFSVTSSTTIVAMWCDVKFCFFSIIWKIILTIICERWSTHTRHNT